LPEGRCTIPTAILTFLRGENDMSAKTDAFFAEIRARPDFIAAAAADPKWNEDLENMERALDAVDGIVDAKPEILDVLDQIDLVVGRTGISLKQRLLDFLDLMTRLRDLIIIIH
jgi:hypothetical protein